MSFYSRLVNWGFRWRRGGPPQVAPRESFLARAMVAVLEDVFAWENPQLSLAFIAFVNIVFITFIQMSITFLECVFIVGMTALCLDGLECWLRTKHRTACLEKLARCDHARLQYVLAHTKRWLSKCKRDFLAMREANPTKAFLVVNLILGGVMLIGRTLSGALLFYLLTMGAVLYPVASPHIVCFIKKMHNVSESDGDLDSLIPELSEHNIKELNVEIEPNVKTRQSVEPLLPEGAPPDDSSDSDNDSHSSTAPLPIRNDAVLGPRDTDSSDEEYVPYSQEQPRTTVEIVPEETWDGTATAAALLRSLGGTISGLVTLASPPRPTDTSAVRKPIARADSSDEFEFLDQTDL